MDALLEKTRPLSVIKIIHCPRGVTSGLSQILYTAFTIIHCLSTYQLLIHRFSAYPFIIQLSMDN